MLIVDLVIMLFHLKLDKFYCIRVMNYLKVICYNFFFLQIKMSYYWINREELFQKAKDRYYNYGGKEKAAEYYIGDKKFIKGKK